MRRISRPILLACAFDLAVWLVIALVVCRCAG